MLSTGKDGFVSKDFLNSEARLSKAEIIRGVYRKRPFGAMMILIKYVTFWKSSAKTTFYMYSMSNLGKPAFLRIPIRLAKNSKCDV